MNQTAIYSFWVVSIDLDRFSKYHTPWVTKMMLTISSLTNKVAETLELLLGFKITQRQSLAHNSGIDEQYSIPPYDDPLY
jgi:hypothetical protein